MEIIDRSFLFISLLSNGSLEAEPKLALFARDTCNLHNETIITSVSMKFFMIICLVCVMQCLVSYYSEYNMNSSSPI